MHVSPSCLARYKTCALFCSCQGERGGASGKGGGGGGKMLINPPALMFSSVRWSLGREGRSGEGGGGRGGQRWMGVEGEGKRKWIVPQVATESAGLPPLPLSHHRSSVQASQHYGAGQSAEPDFWEPARFAQLQQEAKSKSQSASLQTPRHPISWERELQQNYKPCIFILPNPGGDFQMV